MSFDNSSTANVSAPVSLVFTRNTVSHLNFLRNPITDSALLRSTVEAGRVNKRQMQNAGLVIDLYGDFNDAYIEISNNTFSDT